MRTMMAMLGGAAILAACAPKAAPPPIAVPRPVPTPVGPPFPSMPNLKVPPKMADGGYATPNRLASATAKIWHVRAGLNVAALGCRGVNEATIIAGYNAMIRTHKAELARVNTAVIKEYGGQSKYDPAMTSLYNYFALPPAQDGLCLQAITVLSQVASIPVGGLAAFAPGALAQLDQPFAQVFAKQDAWLASRGLSSGPEPIAIPTPHPTPHPTPTRRP